MQFPGAVTVVLALASQKRQPRFIPRYTGALASTTCDDSERTLKDFVKYIVQRIKEAGGLTKQTILSRQS
jgi:hypothetical protein